MCLFVIVQVRVKEFDALQAFNVQASPCRNEIVIKLFRFRLVGWSISTTA